MTLVVLDVVELKQLLADVVVAAFDLALGGLDHAGEHLGLDGLAFFKAELIGDGTHAVAAEDAQELVNTVKLVMDARIPASVLQSAVFTHPSMTEAFNNLFLPQNMQE